MSKISSFSSFFFSLSSFFFLLCASFACGAPSQDTGPKSVVFLGADGLPLLDKTLALPKGVETTLKAAALDKSGAEVGVESFDVSVESEANLEIKEQGAGWFTLKALRDWFDEAEAREPTALFKVCAEGVCGELRVVGVINLKGQWETILTGLDGSQTPGHFLIIQEDRMCKMEVEDFGIFLMALTENKIAYVGDWANTVVEGTVISPNEMKGQFMSGCGFIGTWTAKRAMP